MSSSREPRVGGGVGRTTEDESARPLGVFQGRAIGDREYAGSGRNRVLFFLYRFARSWGRFGADSYRLPSAI